MDHHPASGECTLEPGATAARSSPYTCIGMLLLALVCALAPHAGRAADEDSTTSVYLEFDPKTGDFKTVHDNDRSKQRAENKADDRSMLHPLAPDAAADPAANANPAAASPGVPARGPSPGSASGSGASTPVIVGAAALLAVLLGVALTWFRRSDRKAH
jgi:hypothetical protein